MGQATSGTGELPAVTAQGEFTVQTQVPLQELAPVVYGYHENPFEVLGPHEIEQDGRRALAVRAYLPEAQRAWVVDPIHGAARPMRRTTRRPRWRSGPSASSAPRARRTAA